MHFYTHSCHIAKNFRPRVEVESLGLGQMNHMIGAIKPLCSEGATFLHLVLEKKILFFPGEFKEISQNCPVWL